MKKTKIILAALIIVNCQLIIDNCFGQNIGINSTGAVPNSKALLDLDATGLSPKAGLLIPRMTTAERTAITPPIPESLLIYNTTTRCFEAWNQTSTAWVAWGCIGCTVPTAVTASAAPNPICVGSTLTLTGGATGATSWNWTGPNSFISPVQSPTIAAITSAGAGVYTLAASNTCGSVTASTASVSVSQAPTTAAAGPDQTPACGVTTATLAGNTPTTGTGAWSVVSGTATITTPTSPTSGVTGLAVPGTATLRWTISNSPCAASTDDVVITTTSCPCTYNSSNSFTDARDGKVYSQAQIGSQCWMTQNLNFGTYTTVTSPQVAGTKFCQNLSGINDAACPMGGLYEWANLMSGSVTCNGTAPPPDANAKCATPVQGLCPAGWHIPSHYEWTLLGKNVGSNPGAFPYNMTTQGWRGTDEGGNMKVTPVCGSLPCWNTPNTGATNSSGFTALPGGYSWAGAFSDAGIGVYWWSSTGGFGADVWVMHLSYNSAQVNQFFGNNAAGNSCRCVKD